MGVLIPKLIMNSIRKKIIYIPTARAPMSLFVLAVAGSVLFFPFMPSTLEAEETTVTDSLNSFRTGFSPALILFYGNLIDYSADTTTVGSDSTTINSKLAQIRLILSRIRSIIPPPIDVSDRAVSGSDPARDTVPSVGEITADPYADCALKAFLLG